MTRALFMQFMSIGKYRISYRLLDTYSRLRATRGAICKKSELMRIEMAFLMSSDGF